MQREERDMPASAQISTTDTPPTRSDISDKNTSDNTSEVICQNQILTKNFEMMMAAP